jgi:hypothetical protein
MPRRPPFAFPPRELFRNHFTRCDYGHHWGDITRFFSRRPERDEFLAGLRALFTWFKRDVAWIVFHDLRNAHASGQRPLIHDYRYDPSHELAVEYRLPEAKLNAWLRAISGHSAREWWDNWRAHDPACGLLPRLRDEIEPLFRNHLFSGLTKPKPGCQEPEAGSPKPNLKPETSDLKPESPDLKPQTGNLKPSLDDLLRVLRAARRRDGFTNLARAAAWGYRNPKRLDHACLWVSGLTLRQLEIALLNEILQRWTYDPGQQRYVATPGPLFAQPDQPNQPNQPSAIPIAALRWASFAAIGSPLDDQYESPFKDPDANRPPLPLPDPDPSAHQAVRAPDPTPECNVDESHFLAARILPLPHLLPTRAAVEADEAERAASGERFRALRAAAIARGDEARRALEARLNAVASGAAVEAPSGPAESENSCTVCSISHLPPPVPEAPSSDSVPARPWPLAEVT